MSRLLFPFRRRPCLARSFHSVQSSTSIARGIVQLAYTLHPRPSTPSTTSNRAADDAGAGDGEAPIIFMHGLFGSRKNNRSISKILARELKRDVYAVDLRNHGDSPHDPRHDYLSMAEDVEGFMREHDLKLPTLIGHSMGAKTAMTLALRSPHLLSSLVSVDNAPVDAALKSDFAQYVRGMKRIEEVGAKSQKRADEILKEYEESLPIRQFLLTNLYRPPSTPSDPSPPLRFRIPLRTLAQSLDHMADFPCKDPSTHRFERPSLFVRGTRSHYVADEVLPLIGEFFPAFEVRDVESGHWVVSENMEGFRKAVVEFLQRRE